MKVFRTDDFFAGSNNSCSAPCPTQIWPSGDGTRMYIGLENADALTAIDTKTNEVVATMPIGQAPQAWSMCRTPFRKGLELRA